MKGNLRTVIGLKTLRHAVVRTIITGPMNRLRIFFIGKGFNFHPIRYHKCGIKSKTEMPNNLIAVSFILVFFNKIRRTGKSNLRNILFYFFLRHTDTVILKANGFCIRIHNNAYSTFIVCRLLPFGNQGKLLQLSYRIGSIGNLLTYKNVLIAIHPFLDNGENILTMN